MTTIGNHYKLTVHKKDREKVKDFYCNVLGANLGQSAATKKNGADHIDIFEFPNNIFVGVEYFESDEKVLEQSQYEHATWMELRTENVGVLVEKIKNFGVQEINFWDKDHFYFHAPGGQVFRVSDANK